MKSGGLCNEGTTEGKMNGASEVGGGGTSRRVEVERGVQDTEHARSRRKCKVFDGSKSRRQFGGILESY